MFSGVHPAGLLGSKESLPRHLCPFSFILFSSVSQCLRGGFSAPGRSLLCRFHHLRIQRGLMPDQPQPTPSPLPPVTPEPRPQATPGHMPISEEMDSAKWTLPPIVPVLIAIAAIAIFVGVIAFANRQTPVLNGEITDVQSVETSGGQSTLVAVNVKVHNANDQTVHIKSVASSLTLSDKPEPLTDEAASYGDFERYYQGIPAIKTNAIDPLKPDTRIPAGTDHAGRVIFSYPIPKAQFDARKSLAIKIYLYDKNPVVITK